MAPPDTKNWDIPGFKSVVHFDPDACLLHTVKPKLDSFFPPLRGSNGHDIPPNNFHCTCPHLQNLRGSISRLDTLTVLVEDYPLVSDDMQLCVYIRGARVLAMDFAIPKTSDAFSRQAAYAKKEAWFGVRSTKVKLYECDDVRVTLTTPLHNHFFHKFCAVKSPRRLAYTLLLSPMARKWQRNGVQLDIAVDPARRGISLSDVAIVAEVRLVDPDSKRGQKQMNVAQRVCWYGGDGFSKENLSIIALVEKIDPQKALGLLQQMSSHKCEFWMWERASWQEYLLDGTMDSKAGGATSVSVKGEFQSKFSRQDFLFFWEDVLRIKRQSTAERMKDAGMKQQPMGFLPPSSAASSSAGAVSGAGAMHAAGMNGQMPLMNGNGGFHHHQQVKQEKMNPSAALPQSAAGMGLSNKMEMPQPHGGAAVGPGGEPGGGRSAAGDVTGDVNGGGAGAGGHGVHGGLELGRGGRGVANGHGGSGDIELDFGAPRRGGVDVGKDGDASVDNRLEVELDLESSTSTENSSSNGTRDRLKELTLAAEDLDFGFPRRPYGFPHQHEASPSTPCPSNVGRGKGCIVEMMGGSGRDTCTLQANSGQQQSSGTAASMSSSYGGQQNQPENSHQRPPPGAFTPQTLAPPPALPGMTHTSPFGSSSGSMGSAPHHTQNSQQTSTSSALPQLNSATGGALQQGFMGDARHPGFVLPSASLPMVGASSAGFAPMSIHTGGTMLPSVAASASSSSSVSQPASGASTPQSTSATLNGGAPAPWGMLIGGLEGLGKGGFVSPRPGNAVPPPRTGSEGNYSPSAASGNGGARLPSRSPPAQHRKASTPTPTERRSFSPRHSDPRSDSPSSKSPSSSSGANASRPNKRHSSAMSSSSPAPIEDDTATVVDAESDDHNPEHVGCHWDVTTSCVPPSGLGRDKCSLGYPNRIKPPPATGGPASKESQSPSTSSGMVYTSSACPTDSQAADLIRPPPMPRAGSPGGGSEDNMSDESEAAAADGSGSDGKHERGDGTRAVKRARVSSVLASGTWTEAPHCPSANSGGSGGHSHGGDGGSGSGSGGGKVVRNHTTALIDYPHGCSAGSLSNSHEFVAEVKPCGGLDFLCAAALSCDSRVPSSNGAPRHYHHHHLHHHHVLRPPPSSYTKRKKTPSKKKQ